MHRIKTPRTVTTTAPRGLRLHLATEDDGLRLPVGFTDRRPHEPALAVLASLRELCAMYDGMDATCFWSTQVRAKVERARAVLAMVDGQ